MKKEVVPRNIVSLFDRKLTDELIRLSREVASVVPSKIVLNTTDMLPHLTLYTSNFPPRRVSEAVIILENIAKQQNSFTVTFNKKVIDMQSIFINAQMSDELYKLHERVVDGLNDLRGGFYDENELNLIGDNQERKKSLRKYGMWAAKELYVPHVTIARPEDSSRCGEALSILPDRIHYEVMINSFSLVVRGPNGTCSQVLETFPFSA